MSFDYTFTREIVNGAWDIDNPLRVDSETGKQILLAREVSDQIEGHFIMRCDADVCTFHFDEELSSENQTLLASIVATHKANT